LAVRTTSAIIRAIEAHGEETYPRECCGFLLGSMENDTNVVQDIHKATNEWQDDLVPKATGSDAKKESQRNRYLITPEQWKQADAAARLRGLGIIGYYHSHPDHPAEPSGFDLDHSCWPGESYIIVSVRSGKAAALNSFNKPDYEKFEKEEISIEG
jgi:proteasome lid subunit RPN8/RPN11